MSWYDVFANFYDFSVESVYRPYRKQVVEAMELQEDSIVLDLACGTGANLPYIVKKLGDCGKIFAVDFSEGMLQRLQKKVERQRWENVFPLQCDARKLTLQDLQKLGNSSIVVDRIVVTLGLSVIPDWQNVFSKTFELLAPGGRFVIFDIYAETWVPQTWIVQRFAQADLKRRVWQPLENCSSDFSLQFLPGSPHIHGGKPFIATGIRRQ